MKLRPWLLSSLIGASIVGWLCLIEFYLISNSQNYFYSKHTLTSPLFYSLIAGAALALVLYPLRIVTVSKAIRKQSPHMAVGISILCFSAWYSLNHHFSLDSNTAIVASIAAYSLILLALSGNNNFAFTSFFSPSVHYFSRQ
ncbi:MAG: hypothetical protein QGF46_04590 [Planctomycetota bacterium]|jgi:peptidoglycan/LPS O-acetylase OafA/YrhL|nr:hypothetical protein [Planctomycetota bacterium]